MTEVAISNLASDPKPGRQGTVLAAATAEHPLSETPFSHRHNGPRADEIAAMLERLGLESLAELIERTVPETIRLKAPPSLGNGIDGGLSEQQALDRLRATAQQNRVMKSLLGMGYADTVTPPVIRRNVLESPGWYTAYTPYQAEIAQGRLEALLNFQTMIIDLTGLEVANASLLDEATAAAEAMSLCHQVLRGKRNRFLVSEACHPQTLEVVQTRAWPLGIEVETIRSADLTVRGCELDETVFGVLLQYPTSDGRVLDYRQAIRATHEAGALAVVAADLLALTLLEPPGAIDADVAVGSTQRFGMPMGYGGPHAAFFATRESYRRQLPGRVVGVSKDSKGRPALRLALQTREQHIRRDRATSNICTAQVLPAVVSSMYAVYHGPGGLRRIAERVHSLTCVLAEGARRLGYDLGEGAFFDTLRVELPDLASEMALISAAADRGINLRSYGEGAVGIALDETTSLDDVGLVLGVLSEVLSEPRQTEPQQIGPTDLRELLRSAISPLEPAQKRGNDYLLHKSFNSYHSETEMLRYLHRLQSKDLALDESMIPLGSCTMKLNATAEMEPITWPELANLHPFAPIDQAKGYRDLCAELESWLAALTGFEAISLQPNAGSQGELAGLLVIRKYHETRGEGQRKVCLIPTSAHGTNPASAVMAGLRVVAIHCDDLGNVDLDDLREKAETHAEQLAALMITYPSTHGVFEPTIREICELVHRSGGQVYLDGANLNAQVGICRPGDYGADVAHLNLHKTFCIPHGGGGPGMGPIGVMGHLVPYLPGHRVTGLGSERSIGAVSAAPLGSALILPISWAYIAMMGRYGLLEATQLAILNANYIASRLEHHYPVLYRGEGGWVAHECILDLRPLKSAGIEVEDVAKRLMDYGFHAPTVSWPVAGTMMVEPTESESKAEIDRFCDALISIREEAQEIEDGRMPLESSPLRNAPHAAEDLLEEDWDRPYSRARAAYPAEWTRQHKYWPPVARIDSALGDRNFLCSCAGMDAYRDGDEH